MVIITQDDALTMSPEAVLHYEICKAWWPQFVSHKWAQYLAGKYFAWKTNRIVARFKRLALRKRLVDAHRAAIGGAS